MPANAQATTSLDTLSRLCDVLGMPMSNLFSQYDLQGSGALLVKARRRPRSGPPRHRQGPHPPPAQPRKNFEPYMVDMDDASEEFPTFSHPGTEFLHLLEGELVYRHGNQLYPMQPGDSLTFDGEVPHGPEQLVKVPIRLLSVVNYGKE